MVLETDLQCCTNAGVCDSIQDLYMFACVCLQGVNRMGKDTQVGRDGVRRKDWHDIDAIKRDASRSGWSKAPRTPSL